MAHRPEALAVLGRAVRTPRGVTGLVIAGCVILAAAIGPLVAPYSSTEFVTQPFARASSIAWLGGDVLGRDVLSRTLDGGWELLLMAAVATALGVAAGAALGVIAAYAGGMWDSVIMRVVDVFLAFPQLVFALLLVSILGLRLTYSMLVIAGLSFLGFGLQPPAASWGLMINENRVGLIANPWGVLMPAILIALFTIGVNTFTDAVARASLGVGRRSTEPDPLVDLAVEGATT